MGAIGLVLLVVGVAIAFSVCGALVTHRLIRHHITASHNEVMISLFAMAGVVYAVLLGFLVVVVWEAYDSAHHNVAQEAATLVPLYRLTYGMEPKHGAAARTAIRRYAQAVIGDEWPTLTKDEAGSRKARRAIGALDREFSHLTAQSKAADTDVDREFLRTLSTIVADRNTRLLEATDSVPWVMWLGAIGGGIVVMSMSFLIYMERVWPHLIMGAMASALIGLLLFIMIVLSRPFAGPLALQPGDFHSALKVMDDVDQGY